MCDYSLHNVRSRLALEGEPLQVHRFPTGSLGLASPADLRPSIATAPRDGWWQTIKSWFHSRPAVPAVCIPPGARLILREIPQSLQKSLGVGAEEEVTFTQLSLEPDRYRDAVRFLNQRELLIQQLPIGLPLDVLCLAVTEPEQPRLPAEAAQELAAQ